MKLSSLLIRSIRNLDEVALDDLASVNLFFGENGAGKSSVLEAIHLLALARSFRSAQLKPVISYSADHCVVFARTSPDRMSDDSLQASLGVRRDKAGGVTIKVDGVEQKSVLALAQRLPIQLINAASYLLLDSGPKLRRQFLDWGVFHVEPRFMEAWKKTQRCIRQRNASLKAIAVAGGDARANKALDYWNHEIVQATELLDHSRLSYFESFEPCFQQILAKLCEIKGVSIRYQRGWAADKTMQQALEANLSRDLARGITHSGPHRADLRVTVNGIDAAQVLSRGQLKLLVCAMRLAQMQLFQRQTGNRCILLVDDLPAEIDSVHQRRLCALIDSIETQAFITAIDPRDVLDFGWPDKGRPRLFHVKHGCIEPAD